MIEITHNFDPSQFMWLWTKYVTGFNEKYHCTNSITGRYSKKLWKGNPDLPSQHPRSCSTKAGRKLPSNVHLRSCQGRLQQPQQLPAQRSCSGAARAWQD